jgi:predicted signal transduction protein with EAL and GGDEF domain
VSNSGLVEPFDIDRQSLAISASLGVALYPEHGVDDVELLRQADEAMYEAKRSGRNRVKMCEPPSALAEGSTRQSMPPGPLPP